MQLLVTCGSGTRTCMGLAGKSIVTLGRAEDRTIVLHDPRVSRHHAVIELREEDLWLARDERSVNGTFLNGVRLRAVDAAAEGRPARARRFAGRGCRRRSTGAR